VPLAAPGAALAFLLALPLSRHDGHVASVPESLGVGRVRGVHLRHGLGDVLVRGTDPGSRDPARSRPKALRPDRLRRSGDGVARVGGTLAPLRDGVAPARGPGTPLVVSVHTVVSFDFTIAIVPGWHSTIFPPYFVAGAIYSGFAMVLTLAIPLRKYYHLEDFVTLRHLDNMAKILLATGLIVAYGYMMETFMAFYSGDPFDRYMILNRMTGPYAVVYWVLILCNIVVPQSLLWSPSIRRNVAALFVISLVVQVGMWLERFIIVVTSLHRGFLPSAW